MQYGLYHSRFQEEKVHGRKVVDFGPDVVFDAERCILCTRCVRFCQEITRTNELGIFERGDTAQISTFPGKQLDNPYAGNTVDICPGGALTSKDFRFKIRVWFLQETPSICAGCARGCNINMHHHDGRIYRFKPRRNDAVNETWICDEGRFSYKAIHAETRQLQPQVRQGETLQQTTWQDALRQATALLQRHSSEAVGILVAPQGTNEDFYLLAQLRRQCCRCHRALPGGQATKTLLLRADKNPNSRSRIWASTPQRHPQRATIDRGYQSALAHRYGPPAAGAETATRLVASRRHHPADVAPGAGRQHR
jgi:NADH-quinone oxidoreductase subunit G